MIKKLLAVLLISTLTAETNKFVPLEEAVELHKVAVKWVNFTTAFPEYYFTQISNISTSNQIVLYYRIYSKETGSLIFQDKISQDFMPAQKRLSTGAYISIASIIVSVFAGGFTAGYTSQKVVKK